MRTFGPDAHVNRISQPSMKSLNAYLLTATVVFGLAAGSLQADTFIVTRTNISGPGSLPAIISQANATPRDNSIEFAVLTDPITLLTPLPTVTNNVVINGRRDVPTVISGGGLVSIFGFAS